MPGTAKEGKSTRPGISTANPIRTIKAPHINPTQPGRSFQTSRANRTSSQTAPYPPTQQTLRPLHLMRTPLALLAATNDVRGTPLPGSPPSRGTGDQRRTCGPLPWGSRWEAREGERRDDGGEGGVGTWVESVPLPTPWYHAQHFTIWRKPCPLRRLAWTDGQAHDGGPRLPKPVERRPGLHICHAPK